MAIKVNEMFQHFLRLPQPNPKQDFYVLEKFKTLKTNRERVDFAYNSHISKYPGNQDVYFPQRVEKCDIASLRLRVRGNEMFRDKKDLEALLLYTESIVHAENGGHHLGLAYANRSAVLFEKRYYKECLEDTDRALKSNYPDHLLEKLLNRQKRARILQTQNPKSFCYHEPVPIITNKHPQILAAADCLELKKNETFGTHIVTTRDVEAGEIISVEAPYVQTINTESRFVNCHECLELCFNMIPCEKCATALYCSTTCKTKAFRAYHRHECDFGIIEDDHLMLLKIILLGAQEFKNLKGKTKKSSNHLYRSDSFKGLYDLETSEIVLDNNLYFVCATIVGIMLHCLKNRTKFLQENAVDENTLKDIMLRCLLIEITNFIKITNTAIKNPLETINVPVATALYVFLSRYNHSCVPNCQFVFYGRNVIVRATELIKKGEQCFISYGPNYITCDLSVRQAVLKRFYYLTCRCVACENVWPSYQNLSLEDILEEAQTKTRIFRKSKSSIMSFLEMNHILQLLSDDITNDNGELLFGCFEMQNILAEPCKIMAYVKIMIFHLIAETGNKVVNF